MIVLKTKIKDLETKNKVLESKLTEQDDLSELMNDAVAKIKHDNEAMLKSELKAVFETDDTIKVFEGSVKIITANETDFTAIKELLESMLDITEAFEITREQKRKPQVIVYNIDKKIQAEELLEGLLQKNCFLYDADNVPLVKVEFPIQAQNKESRHWVITIDPSIFKELWLKQGLYFNWSRVRFTEFIGIRQCRTCGAFGHTSKYCDDRDKPPICENYSMLKTENHS
ncbi:hypothetical protein AVEN_158947-1 [Araneus ventricosus]|uniref:CCHC-type domain-containing protein n=1 Tax=Araneus ventricosus TaxID=182803 RepID=A0A4Y2B9V9_ARAVE|nr:hypothetical protein AVEN_158947-1 [Araneus ventricosus]